MCFKERKVWNIRKKKMVTTCKKYAGFVVSSVEGKAPTLDPEVLSLKSAPFTFKIKGKH